MAFTRVFLRSLLPKLPLILVFIFLAFFLGDMGQEVGGIAAQVGNILPYICYVVLFIHFLGLIAQTLLDLREKQGNVERSD